MRWLSVALLGLLLVSSACETEESVDRDVMTVSEGGLSDATLDAQPDRPVERVDLGSMDARVEGGPIGQPDAGPDAAERPRSMLEIIAAGSLDAPPRPRPTPGAPPSVAGPLIEHPFPRPDTVPWIGDPLFRDITLKGEQRAGLEEDEDEGLTANLGARVSVRTSETVYHPGEHYRAEYDLVNRGDPIDVHMMIAVVIDGVPYFYPDWTQTPNRIPKSLPTGHEELNLLLLEGALPPETEAGRHTWYAALFEPDEDEKPLHLSVGPVRINRCGAGDLCAVELAISGGAQTQHPFTTAESLEAITWEIVGGQQEGFFIVFTRQAEGEVEEVHVDWAVSEEARYPVSQALRDKLAGADRYFYEVWLCDSETCGPSSGEYSWDPAYPDWLYADAAYVGYTYDREVQTWRYGTEPQPIPWGPGHHHRYGETSGSRHLLIADDGTLIASVDNRLSAAHVDRGRLLVSGDAGETWTSVPTPQNQRPLTMAWDERRGVAHVALTERDSLGGPNLYHWTFEPAEMRWRQHETIIDSELGYRPLQRPSMVVDDRGDLHVLWYSTEGEVFRGHPFICHARLTPSDPGGVDNLERWRVAERHATPDDNVAGGFIPSVYAGAGRVHMFYGAMGWVTDEHGEEKWQPVGHAHRIYSTQANAPQRWREAPRPFADFDPDHEFNPWFGAFDHSAVVSIEPQIAPEGGYVLHFVAPYTEEPVETGPTHLIHSVYSPLEATWSPTEVLFSPAAYPPTATSEVFEWPSIGADRQGRLAVAFHVRDKVDERKSRNRIMVLRKGPQGWEATPSMVLGRGDGGIGAYRAMMASSDRRPPATLHFVWGVAEHYTRPDYSRSSRLNGYLEDGEWRHVYPIFRGLAHQMLAAPISD